MKFFIFIHTKHMTVYVYCLIAAMFAAVEWVGNVQNVMLGAAAVVSASAALMTALSQILGVRDDIKELKKNVGEADTLLKSRTILFEEIKEAIAENKKRIGEVEDKVERIGDL